MPDLSKHINYPLEDGLYRDWINAQSRAVRGEPDAQEELAFRLYEVARKSNRTLECQALYRKSFSELTQAFVDHCAAIPNGFSSSGPEMARWWDQGRLILAVTRESGRPLGIETPLPMPSQVGS